MRSGEGCGGGKRLGGKGSEEDSLRDCDQGGPYRLLELRYSARDKEGGEGQRSGRGNEGGGSTGRGALNIRAPLLLGCEFISCSIISASSVEEALTEYLWSE